MLLVARSDAGFHTDGISWVKLVLTAICMLMASSANAVTAMWQTAVSGGTAYFSDPHAACQAQYDSFHDQYDHPPHAEMVSWKKADCFWSVGSGVGAAPAYLKCTDGVNAASGYLLKAPGICIKSTEVVDPAPSCKFDNGNRANPKIGNPIVVSSGVKTESVTDFIDADGRLRLDREYRSSYGDGNYADVTPRGLGFLWRFNFQWELALDPDYFPLNGAIAVQSPIGGNYAYFISNAGVITNNNDGVIDTSLTFALPSGVTMSRANVLSQGGTFMVRSVTGDLIEIELYKPAGATKYLKGRVRKITFRGGYFWTFAYGVESDLLTLTDSLGRSISFAWQQSGTPRNPLALAARAVSRVDLPDGATLNYTYDSYAGSLGDFTFARLKTVERKSAGGVLVDRTTYHYEHPVLRYALTGISNTSNVRIATFEYDDSGRATASEHAGGADRYEIAYSSSNDGIYAYRTVTSPLGQESLYTFKRSSSSNTNPRLISVEGIPTPDCVGSLASIEYNTSGRPSKIIDEAASETRLAYYSDGRLQTKTEAYGTPQQRTTTYTWNTTVGALSKIERAGRSVEFQFDAAGRLSKVRDKDVSTGALRDRDIGYDSRGLITSVDGPLAGSSDSYTFSYDTKGYLDSITNALSHTWNVTAKDGAGRMTSMTDPNNVITSISYDGVGRPLSSIVAGRTTTTEYGDWPGPTKVTRPDGSYRRNVFDNTGRVSEVWDDKGNHLAFTFDNAGNTTMERVYSSLGTLIRQSEQVRDGRGRVKEVRGGNGQVTYRTYDEADNLVTEAVGSSPAAVFEYDVLRRLTKKTDPAGGITSFSYDAADRRKTVTDPRGLITRYFYSGFGDLTRLESPDTGVTQFTHDAMAKILTRLDAKGQSTVYQYDLLGRRVLETRSDSTQVSYVYDVGTLAKGRLTSSVDAAGSVSWTYNGAGDVTDNTQTRNGISRTTSFSYDPAGRLSTRTMPSGAVIGYSWSTDAIAGITVNGAPALSQISFEPFGEVKGWNFANGETATFGRDLSGRVTSHRLATISYDTSDRIIGMAATAASFYGTARSYGYDVLDRLTSFSDGVIATAYSYDATGNRTLQTGSSGSVVTAIDVASNRVTSISEAGTYRSLSHDANGSTIVDGIKTYTYNAAGLLSATSGATYSYDGFGRRAGKVTGPSSKSFVFEDNGRISGEYSSTGDRQEIIYLGARPVLAISNSGISYVHTDQLGTPRELSNSSGQRVWAWNDTPFGAVDPNEDPHGLGTSFKFEHRYPGQYHDRESDLFQNWNRDYVPNQGRYLESDPIGLSGGINTYAYVGSNPLSRIDPTGLKPVPCPPNAQPGATCDDGRDNQNEPPRCVTAMCAAGLPPIQPDVRPQGEIECGQCELVCSGTTLFIPGALLPTSLVNAASFAASQVGSTPFSRTVVKQLTAFDLG